MPSGPMNVPTAMMPASEPDDVRSVAVGVVRFGSTRNFKALASETRLPARRWALPAESNYARDGVEGGV